jgi:hypothetical protein
MSVGIGPLSPGLCTVLVDRYAALAVVAGESLWEDNNPGLCGRAISEAICKQKYSKAGELQREVAILVMVLLSVPGNQSLYTPTSRHVHSSHPW